jgi:outer membrane murein-binding lipoprotein Lpp
MSENEEPASLFLTSQHEAFKTALQDRQSGNQIYVVLELLKQLQLTVPDKATAQATFNLISQVLPALGNVASKQDIENLSSRVGTIENAVGRISQTAALSDRDVQQLKEGQSAIKESVKTEAGRLEKSGETTSTDIRELRKAIDGLSTEIGKVRSENKGYLLATLMTIILFVIAVSTFFFKPNGTSSTTPPAATSPQATATQPAPQLPTAQPKGASTP